MNHGSFYGSYKHSWEPRSYNNLGVEFVTHLTTCEMIPPGRTLTRGSLGHGLFFYFFFLIKFESKHVKVWDVTIILAAAFLIEGLF